MVKYIRTMIVVTLVRLSVLILAHFVCAILKSLYTRSLVHSFDELCLLQINVLKAAPFGLTYMRLHDSFVENSNFEKYSPDSYINRLNAKLCLYLLFAYSLSVCSRTMPEYIRRDKKNSLNLHTQTYTRSVSLSLSLNKRTCIRCTGCEYVLQTQIFSPAILLFSLRFRLSFFRFSSRFCWCKP